MTDLALYFTSLSIVDELIAARRVSRASETFMRVYHRFVWARASEGSEATK